MKREALASTLGRPAIRPTLDTIATALGAVDAPRHAIINPAEVEENEAVARSAQAAAVLVLLTHESGGLGVTLTRRTEHLRHHPGQISFPGGRRSGSDRDCIATALREAEEEIGLSGEADLEVLGTIGDYYTVTGFRVTPVIAFTPRSHRDMNFVLDAGEVAAILNVPLEHLMNPANYRLQASRYAGYLRHYYETFWEEQRIWGATAGMLMGLYRELAD